MPKKLLLLILLPFLLLGCQRPAAPPRMVATTAPIDQLLLELPNTQLLSSAGGAVDNFGGTGIICSKNILVLTESSGFALLKHIEKRVTEEVTSHGLEPLSSRNSGTGQGWTCRLAFQGHSQKSLVTLTVCPDATPFPGDGRCFYVSFTGVDVTD